MAKERIGLIGPGRMGLAMVKHMIKGGYDVTVSDINPEPVREAEALGATVAATAAEVGAVSDVVIIAVGYDDEVIQVITGESGLLETMGSGTVIAISSTCSMDTVEDLDAKCRTKDIAVYDAPICRGRKAADEGTLLAVVGAEDDVADRIRPSSRPSVPTYSTSVRWATARWPSRSTICCSGSTVLRSSSRVACARSWASTCRVCARPCSSPPAIRRRWRVGAP